MGGLSDQDLFDVQGPGSEVRGDGVGVRFRVGV